MRYVQYCGRVRRGGPYRSVPYRRTSANKNQNNATRELKVHMGYTSSKTVVSTQGYAVSQDSCVVCASLYNGHMASASREPYTPACGLPAPRLDLLDACDNSGDDEAEEIRNRLAADVGAEGGREEHRRALANEDENGLVDDEALEDGPRPAEHELLPGDGSGGAAAVVRWYISQPYRMKRRTIAKKSRMLRDQPKSMRATALQSLRSQDFVSDCAKRCSLRLA